MAGKKINLCAPIPEALHARVREEQGRTRQSLGAYITQLLTDYYERGTKSMEKENVRTVAFQIPEELFQRLKDHLAAESRRTGRKVSQKDFILGLIQQALDGADAGESPHDPE